ncbi:CpaF family protein [Streptomyces sp. TRM66268-LWL]|uniref:CpaF family protein n=1 Tax=Streptomyces polyasparticus TaxID=2767826 RepID=A0ABR7SR75_9ACTN|nr:ATPase, T2SS/T4P/T4SS family [Streptomyces polyasparticus]MBC9718012.1 CpaF family protein [Streptomyces polyasparticus]
MKDKDVLAAVEEQVATDSIRESIAKTLSSFAHTRSESGLPVQDGAERRVLARRLLTDEITAYNQTRLRAGRPALGDDALERIERSVLERLFGLGPLEDLLADEMVENIHINGADRVFVRYADGRVRRCGPVAASDGELIDLVRRIAARAGQEERRFDRASPTLNVALPDGSRLFAVMGVSSRVSLAIRKHRFKQATIADLVTRLNVCDKALAALLEAAVRARKNIMVSGGTNTGKTTALHCLTSAIDPSERIVTIEDTFELGLHENLEAHPNVVALQAREANLEGEGAIDQAELVRCGLRMSPDRVIVGEVRGAEVIPMCNAMSQGNDGSLSTIHSSTSAGVFTKLAAYAAQSPERLSLEATNLMIASALHFVVHLGWDREGRRAIDSVREVVGADGAMVVSNEIYRPGPDGRAVPAAPLRTESLDDLVHAGLDLGVLRGERWRNAG